MPDEEEEAARVERIEAEAAAAFGKMRAVRNGVAVFGSARLSPSGPWGSAAREMAERLAQAGFTPITGGGPGLMEATNEGAAQAHGVSVGLTIELPTQKRPNAFVSLEVPFHYFFLRKLAFVKYSCAFILLPGGFGTLDELFEALNLRRTHRLEPFPIILFGTEFWGGLLAWMEDACVGAGTLTPEDFDDFVVTDDVGAVVEEVRRCHTTLCRRLGLAT